MKSYALLAAAAGIAGVAAQNYPSDMPQCGHVCGDNLLAMFGAFNCSSNSDYACLCKNPDFGYGVHDCSVEACLDNSKANIVIGWGNSLCSSAGVAANIPTASVSATGTGVLTTSTQVSTFTTGGSTVTSTVATTIFTGTRTPIATSTFTSVVTSGGSTVTSTGVSTIYTLGGGGSGSGSSSSGASGAGTSSGSSTGTGTGSSSGTGSATGSSSTGTGSGTSATAASGSATSSKASSSSSQGAARQTAAPVVGIFAAAGLAAALL